MDGLLPMAMLIGVSEDGSWYKLSSNQWIADFLVDNAPEDLPVAAADEPEPDEETGSADVATDTATDTDTAIDTDDAETDEVMICSCEADYYNCDSFYSQPQAQACYNYCLAEAGDIHQIDPDGNALACEELPEYADDVVVPATTEEDVAEEDVAADIAEGDVAEEDVATDIAVEDIAVEDVAVEDVAVEDVARGYRGSCCGRASYGK